MSVAENIPEMTLQDVMGRVAFSDSVRETPENRIIFRDQKNPKQTKPQTKQNHNPQTNKTEKPPIKPN